MTMDIERNGKSRPFWLEKLLSYPMLTALVITLAYAMYKLLDAFNVHRFFASTDQTLGTMSYLLIGSWLGLILGFFYTKYTGPHIEDTFAGFQPFNLKLQAWSFCSGALSAGATAIYLYYLRQFDPSVILALSSAQIIAIVMIDVLFRDVRFRVVGPPMLIVFAGAILAQAHEDYVNIVNIPMMMFIMVFVVHNILVAISENTEKFALEHAGSVTTTFWRFFWLNCWVTVSVLGFSVYLGTHTTLLNNLQTIFVQTPDVIFFVVVTMLLVFLSISLKQYMKKTIDISKVMIVLNSQVIFALLATIGASTFISADIFGNSLPESNIAWLLRIAGSIILVYGIIDLKKREEVELKERSGDD